MKIIASLMMIISLLVFGVFMTLGIAQYNVNMAKAFMALCMFFIGNLIFITAKD